MRSIYVPLPPGVGEQLIELATRELRDPKAQAAVLIIDGLKRAGLTVDEKRSAPPRRAVIR
jgi:hypothetical protein